MTFRSIKKAFCKHRETLKETGHGLVANDDETVGYFRAIQSSYWNGKDYVNTIRNSYRSFVLFLYSFARRETCAGQTRNYIHHWQSSPTESDKFHQSLCPAGHLGVVLV
jgi:hypothetical protein